jgi:hypothetical protein
MWWRDGEHGWKLDFHPGIPFSFFMRKPGGLSTFSVILEMVIGITILYVG